MQVKKCFVAHHLICIDSFKIILAAARQLLQLSTTTRVVTILLLALEHILDHSDQLVWLLDDCVRL